MPSSLQDLERVEAFFEGTDMSFLPPDVAHNDLSHYFVGFVGDVGPTVNDIMWPNQVRVTRATGLCLAKVCRHLPTAVFPYQVRLRGPGSCTFAQLPPSPLSK